MTTFVYEITYYGEKGNLVNSQYMEILEETKTKAWDIVNQKAEGICGLNNHALYDVNLIDLM